MKRERSANAAPGRVARGDPSDVHVYKLPSAKMLTAADEKSLARIIHDANLAIAELVHFLWPKLSQRLDDIDHSEFRRLNLQELKELLRDELSELISTAACNQPDSQTFATLLHQRLAKGLDVFVETHNRKVESTYCTLALSECLPQLEINDLIPAWSIRQAKLWLRASTRDGAINKFVESHMLLARRSAQAAMRRADEFDDLMNEASLILRHCAATFPVDSEARFSSYALTALRELKRRSPSCVTTRYTANQLKISDEASSSANSQLPDPLTELVLNPRTRREIENARRLLSAARISHDDGTPALQGPLDYRTESPLAQVIGAEMKDRLLDSFRKLTWVEKKVLIGRALKGQSNRNLGLRYRMSQHTIPKIYDKACIKLARSIDPDWRPRQPR